MSKRKILIYLLFLISVIQFKIQSRPWWWAQFSKANRVKEHSAFEKWHSYFLDQAEPNDTVYLVNMAWDDENIYTINGIDGDNTVGINHLALTGGRSVPIRVLTDGNYDADRWAYVQTLLSPGITTAASEKSYLSHNKICFVANKGVIFSSANHGRNGFNYQHNNSVVLWKKEFPDLMKKVEQELNDQYSGLFHSQTTTGNIIHYSPYGDTVELRFSPDDNNNGIEVGAESICGRIRYLIENAKESIIYMANAWGSSSSDPEANSGNKIKDSIINNNIAFVIGAKGSYSYGPVQDDLMNDHTCRIQSPMNDQHSKVFIFDLEIVSAGSANISNAAMVAKTQNDESNIIIHDFRIARRYMNHFHRIMELLDPENIGQPDNYDNVPPNKPNNLTVTAQENFFNLTWEKPTSNTSDFSRYYIFVDSNPIYTNREIGDRIDDDGDGYWDEDPIGNIDRFSSNSYGSGIPEDDDADGNVDEDPWLNPEKQIKDINTVSTTLNTYNVGDMLEQNVNYWFAIVAVDTQGNESICDTSGPHQLGLKGDKTIIITELFYDEGDSVDWIEIYNNGMDTIDLSSWQILEGMSRRNLDNVITNINGVGSWEIKPGQYAVICPQADYWNDTFGNVSDILIDSVNELSFNLTTQTIGLFSGNGAEDTVLILDFPDIAYKGNSIELRNLYLSGGIATSWQASNEYLTFTPGYENSIIVYEPGDYSNIIITEIMYDVPSGFLEGEDEWIEIYNKGNDTVSLSGWKFGYYDGGWIKRNLNAAIGDLLLGPKEYAVLSETPENWSIKGYGVLPQTMIKLEEDITLLSTTQIALFNENDVIVDSFNYPNISTGSSIERINFFRNDYTSFNWESSLTTNSDTHTGGYANTVTEPEISILFPSDLYDTNEKNIFISGATSVSWQNDNISVYVNGISQSSYVLNSDNGTWAANISLSGIGDTVTAELTDVMGRKTYDTITINYYENFDLFTDLIFTEYDTEIKPLYIDIRSFGTGAGDSIIIYNEIANNTDIVVLTEPNGTYHDTITLSDYGDTVWIYLYDRFGNMKVNNITVFYYPELQMEIQTPLNDYETYVQEILINGTTLGTDQGSTVTIYNNNVLNSVNLLQHLDGDFEGTVLLTDISDSIMIKLEDRFDRVDFDTVLINYFSSASIAFDFPKNFYDTNVSEISVSGTSLNSFKNDTLTLFVNGIKQSNYFFNVKNESWNGTIELTNQNDSVYAELEDRFGRKFYDTIIINYFGIAQVGIEYPWNNFDAETTFTTVSGTTYNTIPGDTVKIYLNNIFQYEYVLSDTNGQWNGTSEITGKSDSLTVTIDASWDGINTTVITVNYFEDPQVKIVFPENYYETNVKNIILTGTTYGVNGPDKVELFMNGDYDNRKSVYYIYELNENWELPVELTGVNDSLIVKLTDQFSRIKWDTISVSYFESPEILIELPETNFDTIEQVIVLSGEIFNVRLGDTLNFYVNGILNNYYITTSETELWQIPITMDGINDVIKVSIKDRFNQEFDSQIIGNYYSNLSVSIDSPINNTVVSSPEVILQGIVSLIIPGEELFIYNNNILQFQLNLSGSANVNWSGTTSVENIGDSILVKVIDGFSRVAYDTIALNYLSSPLVRLRTELSIDTLSCVNYEGDSNDIVPGKRVFYTIFYDNDGNDTASNFYIESYIPENTEFDTIYFNECLIDSNNIADIQINYSDSDNNYLPFVLSSTKKIKIIFPNDLSPNYMDDQNNIDINFQDYDKGKIVLRLILK